MSFLIEFLLYVTLEIIREGSVYVVFGLKKIHLFSKIKHLVNTVCIATPK